MKRLYQPSLGGPLLCKRRCPPPPPPEGSRVSGSMLVGNTTWGVTYGRSRSMATVRPFKLHIWEKLHDIVSSILSSLYTLEYQCAMRSSVYFLSQKLSSSSYCSFVCACERVCTCVHACCDRGRYLATAICSSSEHLGQHRIRIGASDQHLFQSRRSTARTRNRRFRL